MNRINPFSDMNYTNFDGSHFDGGFYSNTVPRFGLKGGTRRRKRRKSKLRRTR
jgi:hypothetical protein